MLRIEVRTKGRPEGCTHPCPRPCHSGNCAPCNQYVQFRCHCCNSVTVKPCMEWCSLQKDVREAAKSCGQRCSRNLDCGHRCHAKCHPGLCPDSSSCKKKVPVHCTCKRIKQEVDCAGGAGKATKVKCDDECRRILKEKRQVEEARVAQREAERQREELAKNAR